MSNNTKQNDLFFAKMNYPEATPRDFLDGGLDLSNTGLRTIEDYRASSVVQEKYNKDGKFDEQGFTNAYNVAVSDYNKMTSMQKDIIDGVPYVFEDNYFADESIARKTLDTQSEKKINPSRAVVGTLYPGSIIDGDKSVRELAQLEPIKDINGKTLDFTPNDLGVIGSAFKGSYALATYDKETVEKDPITGEEVTKAKGDYKLNEHGRYYYEELGDRSSNGKTLLSPTDVITDDGSFANKFDFLDSDGKEKAIVGSVLKTASQIIPYFIPYVGKAVATATVAKDLSGVIEPLTKAIEGVTGIDMINDSLLNKISSTASKFDSTKSDYGQSGFLTTESILGMASDTFSQLYSQRLVASVPDKVGLSKKQLSSHADKIKKAVGEKGYEDFKKLDYNAKMDALKKYSAISPDLRDVVKSVEKLNSNTAKSLSSMYMALTSTTDVYQDAKDAGLNDRDAGFMQLGNIAAFYGMFRNLDIGDWALDGLGLDDVSKGIKSAVKSEHKKLVQDIVKKSGKAVSSSKDEAGKLVSIFNTAKNKMTTAYGKIANAGNLKEAALAEGLEEITEEAMQDMFKGVYNGLNAIGATSTSKSPEVGFKFDATDILTRYAMSGAGGAFGGALFKLNDKLQNKIAGVIPDDTKKSLYHYARNGYSDRILEELDKVSVASKDLSPSILDDDALNPDKNIYNPVSENGGSQNDLVTGILKSHVKYIDGIFKVNNIPSDDDLHKTYNTALGVIEDLNINSAITDDVDFLTSELFNKINQFNNLQPPTEEDIKSENPIIDIYNDTSKRLKDDINSIKNEILEISTGKKLQKYYEEAYFNMRGSVTHAFEVKNKNDIALNEYNVAYNDLDDRLKPIIDEKYEYYQSTDKRRKLREAKATMDRVLLSVLKASESLKAATNEVNIFNPVGSASTAETSNVLAHIEFDEDGDFDGVNIGGKIYGDDSMLVSSVIDGKTVYTGIKNEDGTVTDVKNRRNEDGQIELFIQETLPLANEIQGLFTDKAQDVINITQQKIDSGQLQHIGDELFEVDEKAINNSIDSVIKSLNLSQSGLPASFENNIRTLLSNQINAHGRAKENVNLQSDIDRINNTSIGGVLQFKDITREKLDELSKEYAVKSEEAENESVKNSYANLSAMYGSNVLLDVFNSVNNIINTYEESNKSVVEKFNPIIGIIKKEALAANDGEAFDAIKLLEKELGLIESGVIKVDNYTIGSKLKSEQLNSAMKYVDQVAVAVQMANGDNKNSFVNSTNSLLEKNGMRKAYDNSLDDKTVSNTLTRLDHLSSKIKFLQNLNNINQGNRVRVDKETSNTFKYRKIKGAVDLINAISPTMLDDVADEVEYVKSLASQITDKTPLRLSDDETIEFETIVYTIHKEIYSRFNNLDEDEKNKFIDSLIGDGRQFANGLYKKNYTPTTYNVLASDLSNIDFQLDILNNISIDPEAYYNSIRGEDIDGEFGFMRQPFAPVQGQEDLMRMVFNVSMSSNDSPLKNILSRDAFTTNYESGRFESELLPVFKTGVVVAGNAGTGKTTLINRIVDMLAIHDKKVAVFATTQAHSKNAMDNILNKDAIANANGNGEISDFIKGIVGDDIYSAFVNAEKDFANLDPAAVSTGIQRDTPIFAYRTPDGKIGVGVNNLNAHVKAVNNLNINIGVNNNQISTILIDEFTHINNTDLNLLNLIVNKHNQLHPNNNISIVFSGDKAQRGYVTKFKHGGIETNTFISIPAPAMTDMIRSGWSVKLPNIQKMISIWNEHRNDTTTTNLSNPNLFGEYNESEEHGLVGEKLVDKLSPIDFINIANTTSDGKKNLFVIDSTENSDYKDIFVNLPGEVKDKFEVVLESNVQGREAESVVVSSNSAPIESNWKIEEASRRLYTLISRSKKGTLLTNASIPAELSNYSTRETSDVVNIELDYDATDKYKKFRMLVLDSILSGVNPVVKSNTYTSSKPDAPKQTQGSLVKTVVKQPEVDALSVVNPFVGKTVEEEIPGNIISYGYNALYSDVDNNSSGYNDLDAFSNDVFPDDEELATTQYINTRGALMSAIKYGRDVSFSPEFTSAFNPDVKNIKYAIAISEADSKLMSEVFDETPDTTNPMARVVAIIPSLTEGDSPIIISLSTMPRLESMGNRGEFKTLLSGLFTDFSKNSEQGDVDYVLIDRADLESSGRPSIRLIDNWKNRMAFKDGMAYHSNFKISKPKILLSDTEIKSLLNIDNYRDFIGQPLVFFSDDLSLNADELEDMYFNQFAIEPDRKKHKVGMMALKTKRKDFVKWTLDLNSSIASNKRIDLQDINNVVAADILSSLLNSAIRYQNSIDKDEKTIAEWLLRRFEKMYDISINGNMLPDDFVVTKGKDAAQAFEKLRVEQTIKYIDDQFNNEDGPLMTLLADMSDAMDDDSFIYHKYDGDNKSKFKNNKYSRALAVLFYGGDFTKNGKKISFFDEDSLGSMNDAYGKIFNEKFLPHKYGKYGVPVRAIAKSYSNTDVNYTEHTKTFVEVENEDSLSFQSTIQPSPIYVRASALQGKQAKRYDDLIEYIEESVGDKNKEDFKKSQAEQEAKRKENVISYYSSNLDSMAKAIKSKDIKAIRDINPYNNSNSFIKKLMQEYSRSNEDVKDIENIISNIINDNSEDVKDAVFNYVAISGEAGMNYALSRFGDQGSAAAIDALTSYSYTYDNIDELSVLSKFVDFNAISDANIKSMANVVLSSGMKLSDTYYGTQLSARMREIAEKELESQLGDQSMDEEVYVWDNDNQKQADKNVIINNIVKNGVVNISIINKDDLHRMLGDNEIREAALQAFNKHLQSRRSPATKLAAIARAIDMASKIGFDYISYMKELVDSLNESSAKKVVNELKKIQSGEKLLKSIFEIYQDSDSIDTLKLALVNSLKIKNHHTKIFLQNNEWAQKIIDELNNEDATTNILELIESTPLEDMSTNEVIVEYSKESDVAKAAVSNAIISKVASSGIQSVGQLYSSIKNGEGVFNVLSTSDMSTIDNIVLKNDFNAIFDKETSDNMAELTKFADENNIESANLIIKSLIDGEKTSLADDSGALSSAMFNFANDVKNSLGKIAPSRVDSFKEEALKLIRFVFDKFKC